MTATRSRVVRFGATLLVATAAVLASGTAPAAAAPVSACLKVAELVPDHAPVRELGVCKRVVL